MGRKSQSSILQARTNSKLSSRHSNRLEDMTMGMSGNNFSFNDSNSSPGSSSSTSAPSYFFSSPSTASFFSSALYSNQSPSQSASATASPSSSSMIRNNSENLFNTVKLQNQPQSQLFTYHGSSSEKKYPSHQTMGYSNSNMSTRKEIEKSSIDDKNQFDVIYYEVGNRIIIFIFTIYITIMLSILLIILNFLTIIALKVK